SLLCGRDAREDLRVLGAMGERRIAHPLDLAAGHDVLRFDANPLAHVLSDELAVAGEDLHSNPFASKLREDVAGIVARWIEEGEKTREDEVVLVALVEPRLLFGPRPTDRDHAIPLRAE